MTEEQREKCAELWTENEPSLRRICVAKTYGYKDEADDIIGDLYLALCKHVSEKGLPDSPVGWLYRTLYNMIKASFRDKYNSNKDNYPLSTEEIELPYMHDFVDDVIDNFMIEKLNETIGQLTKKEQTILKYAYVDKHKMIEIADLLNSTEKAVKQKRYRLCNKLRDILNNKIIN